MRVEIVVRGFRAIQREESFIYSRFLKLVLNVKTKNDSLRVIDGSHLERGLKVRSIAHSSTGVVCIYLGVGSALCKDGGRFDDGVRRRERPTIRSHDAAGRWRGSTLTVAGVGLP